MKVIVRPLRRPGAIISSRDSSQLGSGYVVLGPGEAVGEHSTGAGEELVIFLAGTAEVVCGSETRKVRAPAVMLVPANIRHNVKNTSGVQLKYLYVYVKA